MYLATGRSRSARTVGAMSKTLALVTRVPCLIPGPDMINIAVLVCSPDTRSEVLRKSDAGRTSSPTRSPASEASLRSLRTRMRASDSLRRSMSNTWLPLLSSRMALKSFNSGVMSLPDTMDLR